LAQDPAGSNVRFLADLKDKKVYAWSPNITHYQAWREVINKQFLPNLAKGLTAGRYITGVANMQGGKWKMVNSDIGVGQLIAAPEKWKWADKYIEITPYLYGEAEIYKRALENK
jgi:hypothetical protein